MPHRPSFFRYSPAPVLLLVASLAVALPGAARAQTLQLTLGDGLQASGAARAGLALQQVPVQDTRVTLGLAYDGQAQLDLALQANDSFGPLGNVVGEGDLALRTDGNVQGSIGARGVLGPLALGLRLSGFSAGPERFDPLAIADATRPRFATGGWGVALDATGRPARTLIVHLAPEFYRADGGTAWRADASLRWPRAIGPHELSLRLRGYLAPNGGQGDAALGVGFSYHRRHAPDLGGAVYLGYGRGGLRPGVSATLAQQLGPVEASLALEAEPYRVDVAPYRLRLSASTGAGPGTIELEGAGASGPAGPRAAVELRYTLPVNLAGR